MTIARTPVTTADDASAPGAYGLLDAVSASLLGTYSSEPAALRVVAELAAHYGTESPAVASLVLYRTDVLEAESVISEGASLVNLALTLTDVSHKAAEVLAAGAARSKARTVNDNTT